MFMNFITLWNISRVRNVNKSEDCHTLSGNKERTLSDNKEQINK